MAGIPELEAMVQKDPRNDEARLVLADALQAKGDPRGTLIMLQHTKKDDEANKLIEQHAKDLLGPLVNYRTTFEGLSLDAFDWHLGFIRTARFGYDTNCVDDVEVEEGVEVSIEKGLEALFAHKSGMVLEEIIITINMLDDGAYFEPVLQALAKLDASRLRSLRIGEYQHAGPGGARNGYDYEISWCGVGNISELWKALPNLEKLVIQSGLGSSSLGEPDSLGAIDLPKLKHLEVISGGISQDNVKSFVDAKWPNLETMHLWFGSSNYGFSGTVEDLDPIFEARAVPKLTRLGLMNSEMSDAIVFRLVSSKIAGQIRDLNLGYGTMTDAGAESLAKNRAAFKKLESLTFDRSYISADAIERLREAFGGVKISAEELKADEGEDDRYVSVSE